MKRALILFSILSAQVAAAVALPTAGSLGAGVVVGDPIGPTVKFWMSPTRAVDASVGFQDDPVIYGSYLWQVWDRRRENSDFGNLGGYVGVGPRFQDIDHGDNKFGVRTVGGINFFFNSLPVEVFVEVAPIFQVSPDTDAEVDAGIGLRFYFLGRR